MGRPRGAAEAVRYIRSPLWKLPPASSFDAAFSNQ